MGSAIAAALVVAGAPMFSAGLRSLRLRRHLRALADRTRTHAEVGFGLVRGRVTLESPLVGPLSGRPCAGYRLEVLSRGALRVATLEDFRPFKLVTESGDAHVAASEGTWELSAIAEREVGPRDPMSENLTALLARSAEAQWVRRCGLKITLVERALLAGDDAYVIGSVRPAEPYELDAEAELERTGTDDAIAAAPRARSGTPERWIDGGGHLDYLHVSDRAPSAASLTVSPWRMLGVVVGPLLGMAGMLYLAAAADALRALTRFVP